VSKRLIIVGIEENEKPITLVNPEITFRSGLGEKDEGCLSLPGVSVPLKRAEKIRIAGTCLDGKSVELEAEGLAAKAFQHEIDHIDGILITDRIGKDALKAIAAHLKAIERGEINPLPE
ncbi:MAG: peptide deformylase, partial [Candidatus Hydrogenedentes bacterium]|nr:peptide deformylase [Candidatus Hydrogenedentota bacterium]